MPYSKQPAHRPPAFVSLSTGKCENRLKAAIDGAQLEELKATLEEARSLAVPPSLIEKAEALLARLVAIAELMRAELTGEFTVLDKAITQARAALVEEETIAPYLKSMLKLRASSRLRSCLAAGEDGYPNLQACYDDALSAQLDGEQEVADIAEAKRLLEALANAQRFIHGEFGKWCGGGYDATMIPDVTDEATVAETGLPGFLDNPQFKLAVGAAEGTLKMSVSVDKVGEADFEEYAVHVVKPVGKLPNEAMQVGEHFEIVEKTEYLTDDAHHNSAATLTFQAQGGCTYFVVPSTQTAKQVGGFSVTTIGGAQRGLDPPTPMGRLLPPRRPVTYHCH